MMPEGGAVTTVDNAKIRHPELDIRYSVELQKGISFARNTAVSLARRPDFWHGLTMTKLPLKAG